MDQDKLNTFIQKAQKAGYSSSDINKFIQQKQMAARATEAAKAGVISPEAAFGAGASVSDLSGISAPLSTAEKKQKKEAETAAGLFENLRSAYFGSDSKEDDLALGPNVLKRAKLGFQQLTDSGPSQTVNIGGTQQKLTRGERADLYKETKDAFLSTLKGISGDTGVLSDQDIKRLGKAFPSFTDSPAKAEAKFQQVRSLLENKLQGAGVIGEAQAAQPAATPSAQPETGILTDDEIMQLIGR